MIDGGGRLARVNLVLRRSPRLDVVLAEAALLRGGRRPVVRADRLVRQAIYRVGNPIRMSL
ncbi:hypothetical protein [Micromonospora sagamiensis]|uniref:Uncharacterized protein n=1 Tax=Micromonospora sagamiensis TaxID=47875 RepID=A0A562WH71_9ACTN|nr:hypothetical protein [Micromonospora sagamiensis]TWJ29623.1 hypothetical protein JD81_03134 [Micromonospora sagamiensis]